MFWNGQIFEFPYLFSFAFKILFNVNSKATMYVTQPLFGWVQLTSWNKIQFFFPFKIFFSFGVLLSFWFRDSCPFLMLGSANKHQGLIHPRLISSTQEVGR